MCNCIRNRAIDIEIEGRNHQAISDGFNALEVAANQARLIAEMGDEREVMLREIKSLKSEVSYRDSMINGLRLELHRFRGCNS